VPGPNKGMAPKPGIRLVLGLVTFPLIGACTLASSQGQLEHGQCDAVVGEGAVLMNHVHDPGLRLLVGDSGNGLDLVQLVRLVHLVQLIQIVQLVHFVQLVELVELVHLVQLVELLHLVQLVHLV
jgi:hypothetical protein